MRRYLNVLGRILTYCNKYNKDDIGCMGIEPHPPCPPMAPMSAYPIKFLSMFNSKKARMVVFKTLLTTTSLMTTSHTIDFPHPSIQFIDVGFLSA
jgi:hypothetical protein